MSLTKTFFEATPPADGVLVTSSRLKCVAPGPGDLELMQKLFGDPAMTMFLGGPSSYEVIEGWLHNWETLWREGISFCGIIEERHSGKHIGSASIHPSTVPNQSGAEISYMIIPEYQRRGYATEMAVALIEHAIRVMKMDQILITASPDNEASNKIALQLGFRCLGEAEYVHPVLTNHTRHAVWILSKIDHAKRNPLSR
jgi:RimJ/RimL family protein N-acetyltransferase